MGFGLRWMWRLLAVGFVALGLAWLADQRRSWERPCWEPARFVGVWIPDRVDSRPARVVAVQPRCPHCMEALAHAAARRPTPDARRLVALIVDWPRRPDSAFAAALGVDEVWWDARSIWRRRWGRRIYGETYDFDRHGRLMGSGHVLRMEQGDPAPERR